MYVPATCSSDQKEKFSQTIYQRRVPVAFLVPPSLLLSGAFGKSRNQKFTHRRRVRLR